MILVIGGTGTTGRIVAATLAERGHPTRIASRHPSTGGSALTGATRPPTRTLWVACTRSTPSRRSARSTRHRSCCPSLSGHAAAVSAAWSCSAPRQSRPPNTDWAWCTRGWVSCSRNGRYCGRPGSWRTSWVSSRTP
ncbi:hypothetical protein NKG94_19965 [Micromonospora sp. M12]